MLVGLIVIAGLSLLAGNLRSETRDLVAYLDEAQIVAGEASRQADAYHSLMRNELAALDRAEFDVLMQTIEDAVVDGRQRMEAVDVPDSAAAAGELFLLAIEAWEDGLDGVQRAVLAIADEPTALEPVDRLSAALLDLQLGDRLYQRFMGRANELAVDLDVTLAEFVTVSFVADDALLRRGDVIAAAVGQSTILGSRRDLAIRQLFFVPKVTGGKTADGSDILPSTDTVSFGVVVSNSGNQVEKGIVVDAVFTDADGIVIASETSPSIDLEPGDFTSVVFSPVDVSPGRSYGLRVTIPIDADDLDAGNNTMIRPIAIGSSG